MCCSWLSAVQHWNNESGQNKIHVWQIEQRKNSSFSFHMTTFLSQNAAVAIFQKGFPQKCGKCRIFFKCGIFLENVGPFVGGWWSSVAAPALKRSHGARTRTIVSASPERPSEEAAFTTLPRWQSYCLRLMYQIYARPIFGVAPSGRI